MHKPLRLALATATAVALTGGLVTVTAATATAADSVHVRQADFNGDGIGDIATSAYTAYVSGHKNAGQVVALYGSATGVSSAKRTTISQNTTGVPGAAEAGDEFGGALAYADFNHDGYDDLAVGSPHEKVGTDTDGGSLVILLGSRSGLTGKSINVPDPAPSSHDLWGANLAAGDFDGDGKADLAVGSSSNVLYVYKGGFTTSGTPGGRYTIKPPIQSGSNGSPYGPMHLTAGDVNGDGRTDLIVDGFETRTSRGWNTNYWIPGTASGLSVSGVKTLKTGIVTGIGDINGDGYGDIVSGASWDATASDGTTIPDSAKGGKVNITYGSASGPGRTSGLTQDTGNVPGASETGDGFGWDLDLGDVNGDGFQDLVVSSPNEDLNGVTNTGTVTVLYGSAAGLNTTSGMQNIAQSTPGVPGEDEKSDLFGADVKLDDVTGDGKADLVVGSYENGGDGAVTYLPSNGTKITTTGSRAISASASGVSTTGNPQFGALFAD
ncbi:FG-GAP and VCBS repeat-containing protein [Streptomyces gilvus]|uniref:FG-GAP and VCBS repeat-containing protein n=1 Tax=Streptomyces gilvus TaxID=2920937 RepID=UPI001F10B8E2|nr:FG-GAP and VCBS repeat-containing protein [Streptomyces sp. CME 23]MCH5674871.1 VCBS repeat-containing protein [Streptomyces sp. CME 23]